MGGVITYAVCLGIVLAIGTILLIWPGPLVAFFDSIPSRLKQPDPLEPATSARLAVAGGMALGGGLFLFGLIFQISRLP